MPSFGSDPNPRCHAIDRSPHVITSNEDLRGFVVVVFLLVEAVGPHAFEVMILDLEAMPLE